MTQQVPTPVIAHPLTLAGKAWCALPIMNVTESAPTMKREQEYGCGKWADPATSWTIAFVMIVIYTMGITATLTVADAWDCWGLLLLGLVLGLVWPVGLPVATMAFVALATFVGTRRLQSWHRDYHFNQKLKAAELEKREAELAPYLAAVDKELHR